MAREIDYQLSKREARILPSWREISMGEIIGWFSGLAVGVLPIAFFYEATTPTATGIVKGSRFIIQNATEIGKHYASVAGQTGADGLNYLMSIGQRLTG